jgi:hypothetical protein
LGKILLICQQTAARFTRRLDSDRKRAAAMADMDMMDMMGISGFGKATKKRTLDPNRFDKNKRDTAVRCTLF